MKKNIIYSTNQEKIKELYYPCNEVLSSSTMAIIKGDKGIIIFDNKYCLGMVLVSDGKGIFKGGVVWLTDEELESIISEPIADLREWMPSFGACYYKIQNGYRNIRRKATKYAGCRYRFPLWKKNMKACIASKCGLLASGNCTPNI